MERERVGVSVPELDPEQEDRDEDEAEDEVVINEFSSNAPRFIPHPIYSKLEEVEQTIHDLS